MKLTKTNLIGLKNYFGLTVVSICLFIGATACGQDEYVTVEDGVIHELQVNYWKIKKPHKVRQVKLRLGQKLKCRTWDGNRVKGRIEEIREDSLYISGVWLSLGELERIIGKVDYQGEGAIPLLLGPPMFVGGYHTALIANNVIEQTSGFIRPLAILVFGPVIVSGIVVAVYGVLFTAGGFAHLTGAASLHLSRYAKS